jgi:hypothetical protein
VLLIRWVDWFPQQAPTGKAAHDQLNSMQVTQLALLDDRVIVGTAAGSIHVFSVFNGAPEEGDSVAADHMNRVTGLGPSLWLEHFVSSSLDGTVKVSRRGLATALVCTRIAYIFTDATIHADLATAITLMHCSMCWLHVLGGGLMQLVACRKALCNTLDCIGRRKHAAQHQ